MDKIKPRLTGIGAFGLSISWEYLESEKDLIENLLIDFEDHRVLFDRGCGSDRSAMLRSLERIRKELTEALKKLQKHSHTSIVLRAIRAECQATQSRIETHNVSVDQSRYQGPEEDFFFELGQFRGVFGIYLNALALVFDLEVDPQFEHILPSTEES